MKLLIYYIIATVITVAIRNSEQYSINRTIYNFVPINN